MGTHREPPASQSPLPEPTTAAGRAGLAALLDHPEQALVALDFDGTLAPIVPDPEQARAHPGAVAALSRLGPALGALAVITGRPAETAVRYGGFAGVDALRRLVVLGAYGAERWSAADGEVRLPPPHPGVAAVREALPGVVAASAAPDASIEDKGRALAVHTRRTADPQGAFEALREPLHTLAERHGLIVEPGRFVLELRPPGMDKGAALRSVVAETGVRTVVYAGDDLGDLAAFDAVAELRAEGLAGLLLCSGSDEVTRLAEQADLVVDGPAGVVAFLDALADRL